MHLIEMVLVTPIKLHCTITPIELIHPSIIEKQHKQIEDCGSSRMIIKDPYFYKTHKIEIKIQTRIYVGSMTCNSPSI